MLKRTKKTIPPFEQFEEAVQALKIIATIEGRCLVLWLIIVNKLSRGLELINHRLGHVFYHFPKHKDK